MNEPIILAARITALPKSFADPMPKVIVYYDNDPSNGKELFEFYPDEITFAPKEFIGLTEAEAKRLKFRKDKDYLQS